MKEVDSIPEVCTQKQERRLPVREKIAYGLGGGGDSIMANLIFTLAYPIYQTGLGIDARLIGLAVGIPRLWDALVDPIIGNLSDNSKSRFGRRKPFIFLGAVLTGFVCMLMWMPPTHTSKMVIFGHFFVCSILYFTSFAMFTIPYNGLGYEMSQDYDERTSVMSYKMFFMCFIATLTLPLAFRMCFWFGPDKIAGVRVVGIIFGMVMILFGILPAILCRERVCHQEKLSVFSAFKYTLKNKPFLIVCGIIFFMVLGVYVSQPLQYYINMAYILPGDEIATSNYIMYNSYIWGIMGFISVPLINYFSRRYGKTTVLQAGLVLIMAGLMLSWFYYTPKRPYMQLVYNIIVSPGMTCIWVILGSFIADVCDVDELTTGRRREGMFGAVYNMALKGGVAFTMVVSGYVVNWIGYQSSAITQSPETILKIRLMMAFIPTAFLSVALAMTFMYPLSRQKVIEIRNELNARRCSEV
ncbi:MAG: MFS transporter [Phycisphaerae bacterium]|jgi:GPH family glycoside/pentoside/hexuronide:cation symporter